MKGKVLVIFLFLVLSFGLVSSVDISVKDQVKLGENFVVKVSGSFYTQPTTSDIKFYREGITTSFGIVKLEKIEGEYYFFLEIPLEKIPGNYSVVLEDIEYNSGRDVIEGDVSANFEVLNEMAPFSISPPLLITSEDYDVEIQNLMDSQIKINLEKTSKPSEVEGESVETGGFLDALFSIFGSDNTTADETPKDEAVVIEEPTSGNSITLMSGEKKILHESAPEKKGFQLLELYYNGESYGVMVYSPEGKPEIEMDDDEKEDSDNVVNETEEVNETKTEDILEKKGINESEVIITDEGKVLNKTTNKEIDLDLKTCAELNGTSCPIGQKCNGKTELTIGAQCCLGTCEVIKKSSTGKVVGWFIIAAIAIFLTWFFKQKYKKAAPKKIDIVEASKPKSLRI